MDSTPHLELVLRGPALDEAADGLVAALSEARDKHGDITRTPQEEPTGGNGRAAKPALIVAIPGAILATTQVRDPIVERFKKRRQAQQVLDAVREARKKKVNVALRLTDGEEKPLTKLSADDFLDLIEQTVKPQ